MLQLNVLNSLQGVIGKLSSKLHKNENNTDILLYQIYLPKLHKNILKNCRLNFFKEIATSSNQGLQTTLESFASFFECLFV